MKDDLQNENTIRRYLLGQINDETMTEMIELRLLSDRRFQDEILFWEDQLIDEYSAGRLSGEELNGFEKHFLSLPARRDKVLLTKSLSELAAANRRAGKDSAPGRSFFGWMFAPRWAVGLVVLITVVAGIWWAVNKPAGSNELLAELEKIYAGKRTVEARIAGFSYAPQVVLRGGEPAAGSETGRRKIEIKLIEDTEAKADGESFNSLGVFYLTGKNFDAAIKNLEKARQLAPHNAVVRSNLGAALLEKAKLRESAAKFEILAFALEETGRAVEIDRDQPAALFNRALILQEMNLDRQAIDAWQTYLEKDSSSPWAAEARTNLQRLERQKAEMFKSREAVWEDFLTAFRQTDEARVWAIHSQSREISTGQLLPLRLARSYLEALRDDRQRDADEFLRALNYLGTLERTKAADFFYAELAIFYRKAKRKEAERLLTAHRELENGFQAIGKADYAAAQTAFEHSRQAFLAENNIWEAKIAEHWIGHCLTRRAKIRESGELMQKLASFADRRHYKWLAATALDWQGTNFVLQGEFSRAIEIHKKASALAETIADVYLAQRINTSLTELYTKIGETDQALIYISRNLTLRDLYFQSTRQAWRNYIFAAQVFNRKKLPETAIAVGQETLLLEQEIFKNPATLHNSNISLSEMFEGKKDFERALLHAEKSREAALQLPADASQNLLLAHSELQIGSVRRQAGDSHQALVHLENAVKIYTELSEYQFLNYEAQKEKLLCFRALGQKAEFGAQLSLVLDLFERHRKRILEEKARNVFFDREQSVYDLAIEYSWQANDRVAAFDFAERSKARSLLDQMNEQAKISDREIYFADSVEPFSSAEIEEKLPESVQVIQFAVLPDKTLVWVGEQKNVRSLEIPVSAAELDETISDYFRLMTVEREDLEGLRRRSADLFGKLLAPLIPFLNKNKEIYIVPDKSLNRLSFASLVAPDTGRYLVEDFVIGYAPSVTVFLTATKKASLAPEGEKLLSIGNPAFDRQENMPLDDLSAAAAEVDQLSAFYPRSVKLTGTAATKDLILKELKKADIFHFAGHYLPNPLSPLYSKLLLADQEGSGENDLRVYEIAGARDHNIKLAVLSACQTGFETQYNGEGAIGASRFFLAIGVPKVVASQWEVDSAATADLMTAFHKFRKTERLSTNRALQKAQVAMLNDRKYAGKPFFWSAFSSVGGLTQF